MKFQQDRRLAVSVPVAVLVALSFLVWGAGPASATGGPRITSISPVQGPAAGGQLVRVFGTGFEATSTVSFGSLASPSVTFQSSTELQAISPASPSGTVDVRVANGSVLSTPTSLDEYTFNGKVPGVTSISPSSGTTAGGTTVTITGTGFEETSTVSFGPSAASSVSYVSATEVQATSPAGSGMVDVQVANGANKSPANAGDEFTYNQAIGGPTITSVTPKSGTIDGGTVVSVTGTGFGSAPTVLFGTLDATAVTHVSSTSLQATAPAEVAGQVDIRIISGTAESPVTTADQFTFAEAPSVTSISPKRGLTSGGTLVTVTGKLFTPNATVDFGATPGLNVNVISPSQLQVTSPPEAAGPVDVTVSNFGLQSAVVPKDQFSYVVPPSPTINVVAPITGPATGGTVVTISGTNFIVASKVFFGTTQSKKVVYFSRTRLTAAAPAESVGTVDIRVFNGSVGSPTLNRDEFTFKVPPAPVVDSVGPESGPAAGGTNVLISGTSFTPDSKVMFGTQKAAGLTFFSRTKMQVVSPPGVPGSVVDIRVISGTAESVPVARDQFTYDAIPGPVINSISPNNGPSAGGTVVTITGTNFDASSVVKFGNNVAVSTYISRSQLTATAPPGSGTVHITVTNGTQTSPSITRDEFTYTN